MARGQAAGLPRCSARAWARPTPCSARGTAGRARHRRGRRVRRDPRPPAHRRADRGPRGRPAPHARRTAAPRFDRDGRRRGARRRRPQVALVDELAHTNVPGSRNEKRWQDVEELLAAGIDVITTVNIQHLESLNDVVEKITGVPQRETRARRRRPRGRPGRARRHGTRGAAAPAGPRQRLRRREGRRRAGQLLPGRQPHRPARAGPAVDRRQGRRSAAALPRAARHRPDLGDPRTGRRRPHRRPRGRDPDPPCGADRGPLQRRGPARRARRPLRRADRRQPRHRSPRSDCWWRPSAGPTTRSSATTCPDALLSFARAENATQLVLGVSRRPRLAADPVRSRHRRDHDPALRRHRRPHRHPRACRQGPRPAAASEAASPAAAGCRASSWPSSCPPC